MTFPENYQADELKGKDVQFEIKIHEIKTHELPEVDDEFVKDVSEFDTLDELKAMIEKELGGTVTKFIANKENPEVVIEE